MKKLLTSVLFLSLLGMGSVVLAQDATLYGKKFETKTAIPVSTLQQRMGDKDEMPVIVSGTIVEVCQVAGCWITLRNENGENLFVKIKEHDFAVPKDMGGHQAVVKGTAVKKTVSVEEQKHYAEDAGKTESEIAAITEPKTEIRVNATAMYIK